MNYKWLIILSDLLEKYNEGVYRTVRMCLIDVDKINEAQHKRKSETQETKSMHKICPPCSNHHPTSSDYMCARNNVILFKKWVRENLSCFSN